MTKQKKQFTEEELRQILREISDDFQRAINNGLVEDVTKQKKTHFIKLPTARKGGYNDRSKNVGHGEDACFLCGRPIHEDKRSYWVHYTTDGDFTDLAPDEIGDLSQGYFPVGADCRHKLPKGFVSVFEL